MAINRVPTRMSSLTKSRSIILPFSDEVALVALLAPNADGISQRNCASLTSKFLFILFLTYIVNNNLFESIERSQRVRKFLRSGQLHFLVFRYV